MTVARLLLLSGTALAISAGSALAGSVTVPIDHVTLVSFDQPIVTAYMGNASIAEVTVIDSRHLFVLGKRFGSTNLIALGQGSRIVANDPVVVPNATAGTVTIFRGADTYNYSCTRAHCETRPVPGDPQVYYDNTEKPASEHEDAGTKGAAPAPSNH